MNNKNDNGRRACRLALHAVLAGSLLGGSGAAFADRWGIQAGGGFSDRHSVDKGDLGVVWDPGWTWWEVGGWHFAFVMEGHVGYWHTNGNIHTSIWEVGATPVIRFIKSAGAVRPYVEAGGALPVASDRFDEFLDVDRIPVRLHGRRRPGVRATATVSGRLPFSTCV